MSNGKKPAPGWGLVEQAGQLLYGNTWQQYLAADLSLHHSALTKWKSGLRPIPAYVLHNVAGIARDRGQALLDLANRPEYK